MSELMCSHKEFEDWISLRATKEFLRQIDGWILHAMEELSEENDDKNIYRQQGRIRALREVKMLPDHILILIEETMKGDE